MNTLNDIQYTIPSHLYGSIEILYESSNYTDDYFDIYDSVTVVVGLDLVKKRL